VQKKFRAFLKRCSVDMRLLAESVVDGSTFVFPVVVVVVIVVVMSATLLEVDHT
jgi:hypothetical protein